MNSKDEPAPVYIRTASKRDLPAIRRLLVETWHNTYDEIYGVQVVDEICDEWHSPEQITANMEMPHSEFVVADTGREILGTGFATLNEQGIKLHQLYVSPAAQGRGLGEALLSEIEQCFEGEATNVTLEVEPENTGAIKFYEKHGFKQAGKTDNCGKDDSGISALILKKQLSAT